MNVGFFGAIRVMLQTDRVSGLVEEFSGFFGVVDRSYLLIHSRASYTIILMKRNAWIRRKQSNIIAVYYILS
jgi:hypothetical protein